jgi:putative transposase
MSKSPDSPGRIAAMTKNEGKSAIAAINDLFAASPARLCEIVRTVIQEMLEAEMTHSLGAEKGERTDARLGYRSRCYSARTSTMSS